MLDTITARHNMLFQETVSAISIVLEGHARSSATAEIARAGCRYAFQYHSSSLMLTPIESPCATSY